MVRPSARAVRVAGRGAHSKFRRRSDGSGSRKRTLLFAAFLLVLGVCMLAYPALSDYLNRVEQAKVSDNLQQIVQESKPEDLSSWYEQAVSYNERLYSGVSYVVDPFDPNAVQVSDKEYLSLLNLAGDGVMGTISIPSIDVEMPIYHGTDGEGMAHGVGHQAGSSLPVGGPSTHAVLAGHTGLPSAVIFDRLEDLRVGDYFIIQVLDQELAYRVTSTEVVLPDNTSSLGIKKGEDLITLVTCTPYGVNSHRLLVHAERCEVPQGWLDRKENAAPEVSAANDFNRDGSIVPILIGVMIAAALLILAGVIVLVKRSRPRGKHFKRGLRARR